MRIDTIGLCSIPFTAAMSLTSAPPATAQIIEVAQESAPGRGDFDRNRLGVIATVDTTQDVVSYYSYGVPYGASFNGPAPVTVDHVSFVFVLKTTATRQLSLVLVHDRPEDGSGGNAKNRIDVRGDPDGAAILVKDDPGNIFTGNPGDSTFTADLAWGQCCTDGVAIGYLDQKWEVYVAFTEVPNRIDKWRAYSGSGAEVPLELVPDRRIRLRPFPCSTASWQIYGKGWPGTHGVPRFDCDSDPVLGSTIRLRIGNSAGVDTTGGILFGTRTAVVTPLGGTLLVKPLVSLGLKLSVLGLVLTVPIPGDPALCGVAVATQVWELDRGASHRVSFTPGLELRLGN